MAPNKGCVFCSNYNCFNTIVRIPDDLNSNTATLCTIHNLIIRAIHMCVPELLPCMRREIVLTDDGKLHCQWRGPGGYDVQQCELIIPQGKNAVHNSVNPLAIAPGTIPGYQCRCAPFELRPVNVLIGGAGSPHCWQFIHDQLQSCRKDHSCQSATHNSACRLAYWI